MAKAIRKKALRPLDLKVRPEAKPFLIWDELTRGLALSVLPTARKSWKFIYAFAGKTKWYTIGDAEAHGLEGARKQARELRVKVDKGIDPQADKRETARRKPVTFDAIAQRYVEEHAQKNNRSWKQSDYLIRKHVLPQWRGKSVADISRSDVKELISGIKAPVVANQCLAAVSAVFTWAIKEEIGGVKDNPCKLVPRNAVQSRERVLSDSEVPVFWSAFDDAGLIAGTALKLILLTGQRPGEVAHMRREHIKDGWWEMPGAPDAASKWRGTKNGESHRVWLSAPVQELLAALEDDRDTGFVLSATRPDLTMREICVKLGVTDKVTPHDLRRTNGTTITGLGFGRDAMNRIQNHKEGGIGSVYDRHQYADENKRVMEAVAAHIMRLATGKDTGDDNVVPLRA